MVTKGFWRKKNIISKANTHNRSSFNSSALVQSCNDKTSIYFLQSSTALLSFKNALKFHFHHQNAVRVYFWTTSALLWKHIYREYQLSLQLMKAQNQMRPEYLDLKNRQNLLNNQVVPKSNLQLSTVLFWKHSQQVKFALTVHYRINPAHTSKRSEAALSTRTAQRDGMQALWLSCRDLLLLLHRGRLRL